jgi:hypothetical protein
MMFSRDWLATDVIVHFRHKILTMSKASWNATSQTRQNGGSKAKMSQSTPSQIILIFKSHIELISLSIHSAFLKYCVAFPQRICMKLVVRDPQRFWNSWPREWAQTTAWYNWYFWPGIWTKAVGFYQIICGAWAVRHLICQLVFVWVVAWNNLRCYRREL